MKKILCLLLCVLILFSNITVLNVGAIVSSEPEKQVTTEAPEDLGFAPDRVIVKLKSVSNGSTLFTSSRSASSVKLPDLGIDVDESRLINPCDTISSSTMRTATYNTQKNTQNNTFVITLKDSGTKAVKDALEILSQNPRVEYATPDIYLKTCETAPNDKEYLATTFQDFKNIKAQLAWDITTGSKDVVVGIIDTGIDGTHPDLKPNLWKNPKPGRNGYKNDTYGYDFANHKGGTPTDADQHGTHVAGIVAAKGNNDIGVCGVSWNSKVAWLRIADNENNLSVSAAVEAINYANINNIPILNASWGGYSYSSSGYDEFEPLEEAIRNYKGIFITAAGNEAVCTDIYPFYPACFDLPNIISVGASNSSSATTPDLIATSDSGFTNYGIDTVDILAPGCNILSTIPDNQYDILSGTSMASPFVAGVAALVKSKYPNYNAGQIKDAILDGAVKNGRFTSSHFKNGAALNAYGALLDTKPAPEKLSIGPMHFDIEVELGQSLKIFAMVLPNEADQSVIWTSGDTSIVKIDSDGKYTALSVGETTITATSIVNPSCKKTIKITVIPAESTVVEFEDKDFKFYYLTQLNEITVNTENGIRHLGSKIYSYETEAETWFDLRGLWVKTLNDLKAFPNLEVLQFTGTPLSETLDVTFLKKLERLETVSMLPGTWRFTHYEKNAYDYKLKNVKAVLGGLDVELSLAGAGFMEIRLQNCEGATNSLIEVFYEECHKPVDATLNGEILYSVEYFFNIYEFNCDKSTNIDIEVQKGIEISNPKTFQKIGEKLKKSDPKRYTYYNWESDYELKESDIQEFFYYKPICQFDLDLLGIENPVVSLSKKSYTYNGKVQTPTVTVKDFEGKALKKNKDYTLSYSSGRKLAGTYYITVKFKGAYSGSKKLSYKIKPISATKCTAKLSTTAYTYNGNVKTPSVTVKNQWGTTLTKNIHYTVSYASGRKSVGTYKVTIKMKGNYSGTKTLYFRINPPKTTVSKLTAGKKSIKVYVAKKSTQVTGYQIYCSTSKSFKSNVTKKYITSYKTTSITLKNLSAKKNYYVKVRTYKTVNGKKYYSAWSAYKYAKTK